MSLYQWLDLVGLYAILALEIIEVLVITFKKGKK